MKLEKVILLETAADHLTGEEIGDAIRVLNDSGLVLDALYLPGIGKKNRPSGLFQVLCYPAHEAGARDLMFMQTQSLGIRRLEMERYALERETGAADVLDEGLRAKTHFIDGMAFSRPEADDLAKLGERHGLGMAAIRFLRKDES